MKRLIYEIVKHGVDTPDNFLGCGVTGTEFTHKATGTGSSEREAGRDALEIFWQREEDFKEVGVQDLVKLESEIEKLDEAEDAHDKCGLYGSSSLPEEQFDCRDCQMAHYVSIRWAVKEAE